MTLRDSGSARLARLELAEVLPAGIPVECTGSARLARLSSPKFRRAVSAASRTLRRDLPKSRMALRDSGSARLLPSRVGVGRTLRRDVRKWSMALRDSGSARLRLLPSRVGEGRTLRRDVTEWKMAFVMPGVRGCSTELAEVLPSRVGEGRTLRPPI